MATGGTIPSNRTQSVTFYNTTGVIEREKNMYFVPRFKGTVASGSKVNSTYLAKFNLACPPSSAYSAISLSNWSPEDRTLVVKGDIDDFRLVSDEGACLNYFIITRTVTKGNTTNTYYYGFFITGVEQVGGSSVKITAEPDDFTNVFYLHNKHALTTTEVQTTEYDPFNEKMKNCYVNRQHYDRVKYDDRIDEYTHEFSVSTNSTELLNMVEIADIGIGLNVSDIHVVFLDVLGNGTHGTVPFYNSETGKLLLAIRSNDGNYYFVGGYVTYKVTTHLSLIPTNINIFLNQEESFKFKYQYKNKKYPLSLLSGLKYFTNEDLEQIESTQNFNNLSQSLRTKIVRACVQYIVVEFKSFEVIGIDLCKVSSDKGGSYHYTGGKEGDFITRPNPIVAYPFVNIPTLFEKYSSYLKDNLSITLKVSFYNGSTYLDYTETNLIEQSKDILNSVLSNSNYGDYILSANIVPYLPLEFYSVVSFDINNKPTLVFNSIVVSSSSGVSASNSYIKGLHAVGLLSPDKIGYSYKGKGYDEILVAGAYGTLYTYPEGTFKAGGGMLLSDIQADYYEVDIDEDIPSLKTNYYDPVLESEPYSFYSMSYLAMNEVIFSRNRYYTGLNSKIKFKVLISINEGVRFSIINSYTVENYETPYFNEGLSTIVTNMIPIVSDSYKSYYYENMSRMKNQFAVNDYNRRVDLFQNMYVSTPASIIKGYIRGGGASAGAEAVVSAGNIINEAVDWQQATKVIEMNQKAILADIGRKPDSFKQGGSDIYYDLNSKENTVFFNHYTIDSLSYQSIAKMLERVGYQVNLYDNIHAYDRVGWNFVKLNMFDWSPSDNIMVSQENTIRKIFAEGVTLLHDKSYLTSGHNYEIILN